MNMYLMRLHTLLIHTGYKRLGIEEVALPLTWWRLFVARSVTMMIMMMVVAQSVTIHSCSCLHSHMF